MQPPPRPDPALRPLLRVVSSVPTSDGAGVKLRRSIGTAALDRIDPFLLLDEFRSEQGADYLAGFPDHPHRGFETVTYMLAGAMRHRDHAGNEGHLRAGSVQWMTAGRGIVHSEMPEQTDGLLWGFQLWVNLPARDKWVPPRYQDIPPEDVPEVGPETARVRVIAGQREGVEGPVRGIVTQPLYLDVRLAPEAAFEQALDPGHNACCYVYEGALESPGVLRAGQLGVLGPGQRVAARAGAAGARLLLIAGRPIGEPVVRHGPFVMNTHEEILQAVRDFRAGRLG